MQQTSRTKALAITAATLLALACDRHPKRVSFPRSQSAEEKFVADQEVITQPEASGETQVELVSNLSYSIDTEAGSPDCPQLKSLRKRENVFEIGGGGGGDGIFEAGPDFFRIPICKITGTVVVPAGYVVAIEANERIGVADFALSSNTLGLLTMRIDSDVNGETFSNPYLFSKSGPIVDTGPVVFERTNEANNPLQEAVKPIDCEAVRDTPTEMKFSITWEAALQRLVDVDEAEEDPLSFMIINELPSLALKPIKCQDTQTVEVPTAAFVYDVDEASLQDSCPMLKSLTKEKNALVLLADPYDLRIAEGAKFGIQTCVVKGKLTIPAKHLIRYFIASEPISVEGSFAPSTQLVAGINTTETVNADERFFADLSNRINGLSKEGTLSFAAKPPLDGSECQFASEENETADFVTQFFFKLDSPNAVDEEQKVSINALPGLGFELVKCP